MSYSVVWADHKAKKVFDHLSGFVQSRVQKEIANLSINPRPAGVKKLSGRLNGVWRLRIGDYRLLYDVDDKQRIVWIFDVRKRNERTYG